MYCMYERERGREREIEREQRERERERDRERERERLGRKHGKVDTKRWTLQEIIPQYIFTQK